MFDAVVLGGGIAGLAFANAAAGAGRAVTVVEASPTLRASGSGLVLSPLALRALRRIGRRDAVVAVGRCLTDGLITDRRLRPLGGDTFGRFATSAGEPFVGIERAALIRVLADCAVPVRLGARAVATVQHPDRVEVALDDGSTIAARIAVFADGARSLGHAVVGDAARRDAGQISWRGVAAGVDLGDLATSFRECWGSEWRFGLVPLGDDRSYWFAVRRQPAAPATPLADRAALIRAAAKPFPPIFTRLIDASIDGLILENRLEDLAPLSRWHCGRVVCIGDAAHAMTPNLGQGASQAIEDGVLLAQLLPPGAADPTPAFTAFEALRKAHAERTVCQARRIGMLAHPPQWLAGPRDALMRAVPPALTRRSLAWLYAVTPD